MKPFNAVCAPSRSRPQLPVAAVRADLLATKTLMGVSGVAGFTEISHRGIKALFASVFGHRVGLSRSDCPIVWTPDFAKMDGGTDFGAAAIRVVAPIRWTTWAQLERNDGLVVGMVAVHMHPGGYAAHPSRAQRFARPLIQRRWKRHAARIGKRVLLLAASCDVVVMVGDINRPDDYTWHPLIRETGRGLLYLGTDCEDATVNAPVYHRDHADHKAAVVTITPKEHR